MKPDLGFLGGSGYGLDPGFFYDKKVKKFTILKILGNFLFKNAIFLF
jgi:hypothetical protein